MTGGLLACDFHVWELPKFRRGKKTSQVLFLCVFFWEEM
jgi:hypothetical protein